ncbi:hypothetical protein RKD55_001513 [Rossellomorea marisflavi]
MTKSMGGERAEPLEIALQIRILQGVTGLYIKLG